MEKTINKKPNGDPLDEKPDVRTIKELDDLKAMRQASRIRS